MGGSRHDHRVRHGPTGLTQSRKGHRDSRCPVQGQLDPNEWTLSQQTCDKIFHRFGRPLVDLFAGWDNNRLPTFCSREFHPQAFHIDDMSLSWDGMDAYLCMISQVLRKIRFSRGRLILVPPSWPRRPWFGEILQLLTDTTAILPDTPHLLSQRRVTLAHPNIKGLTVSCLEIVRSSLRQRGLSEAAAAMAADARRRSTVATYNSRLRRFGVWCRTRQALPTNASLTSIADFLLTLFQGDKQVTTIKNYRSAIAAIHQGFPDGSTPGNRETEKLPNCSGEWQTVIRVRRLLGTLSHATRLD
ncbi:hypothetical protein BSL78_19789 [Apostichopus japonicus]|uniref:Core-binding (CB) domain-containing protein n=1 Tax=Stichopus japonicus TaxID=307972 RepID=A0A2G8K5Q9_STIJA|nr:hypothetical protein BSL78_19789 [Apostichopus japonicus]